MLFSVVIPTYNRARLLSLTLGSVFGQAFQDYEVIVVDDGSTDGTREYLASMGHPITCFSQPNKGPGAARNLGVQHARGVYLAFLDSDDVWFPWTLTCFAELIRRFDGPAILGAKLVEFITDSELAGVREAELKVDTFADYFASHGADYFVGAGMSVLRRDEFIKSGGYTEGHINAEDHDLILRMGTQRGYVQIQSPVTLGWRRHADSATMSISRTLEGSWYLIEQERRGTYPGGPLRARARREIITSHTRPVSLQCLSLGLRRESWANYLATLWWNAKLGRLRYLAGFPVLAGVSLFGAARASLSLRLSSGK